MKTKTKLQLSIIFYCFIVCCVADDQQAVSPAAAATTDKLNTDKVVGEEQLSLKQNKANSSVLTKPLSGTDVLSLIFGLFMVLFTIVAVVWLIKRFGRMSFTNHNQMQIIAAMNLGAREKLLLLQIGEKQILLGATATSIRTLHVLDQPLSSPEPIEPFSNTLAKKIKTMLNKSS